MVIKNRGGAPRPDIDWLKVRAEYSAGESILGLAKKYGVSRAAIQQRRKRYGWELNEPENESEQKHQQMTERLIGNLKEFGMKTVHNQHMIYEAVKAGMPISKAAFGVGLDESTVRKWRKEDDSFDRLIRLAASEFISQNLQAINEAARRGDAKAAQWMLERNPWSKEDFGRDPEIGRGGIKIELSFQRGTTNEIDLAFDDLTKVENADFEVVGENDQSTESNKLGKSAETPINTLDESDPDKVFTDLTKDSNSDQ